MEHVETSVAANPASPIVASDEAGQAPGRKEVELDLDCADAPDYFSLFGHRQLALSMLREQANMIATHPEKLAQLRAEFDLPWYRVAVESLGMERLAGPIRQFIIEQPARASTIFRSLDDCAEEFGRHEWESQSADEAIVNSYREAARARF